MPGKVYLVGAGPGDPGLITVKGRELLKRARVVIYDQLASPELLKEAPAAAELIYVGKKAGAHALPQEEINRLLVAKAQEAPVVVRLKGGDPFVFGRGGEEAEALAAAGVPFEVVPGVTSAVAVPAYAGIPVTHRGLAAMVTFVTGHEDPTKGKSDIPWEELARLPGTLVFLMGVKNLAENCAKLLAGGRAPKTPAALIQEGTLPTQRTVTGTLADIARRAEEAGISPPAILVVGEVAGLRERLKWWETRPLWGKVAVVTRTRQQAGALSRRLADLGARVVEIPALLILPPEDFGPLDQALAGLQDFRWLIFTSANGVEAFFRRLGEQGRDLRAVGHLRLAAIGPATAQALERRGLRADIIPGSFVAEELARALLPHLRPGDRVLLPRAAQAREALPDILRQAGVEVVVVPAYRMVPPPEIPPEARPFLEEGRVDILTFASSATVHHFAALVGRDKLLALARHAVVAAIGPITAATLEEYGLTPQVQPQEYTIAALAEAVAAYFQARREGEGRG